MLLPSMTKSSTTRFYVKSGHGAYIESDRYRTQEEASKEMQRERWKGRNPAVVMEVTTETIVEEGE